MCPRTVRINIAISTIVLTFQFLEDKRWSKEEDEKLAKIIAESIRKTGERPTFPSVVPAFNGERTQKQIYQRYHHIQHRIMPDGTLLPDRKPTAKEELDYLEK